jgi:hypothetical protein
LQDLVKATNAAHERGYMYARQSVDAARLTGRLLLETKQRVPHGKWAQFVAEHYRFSQRSAQGYMRLATLDASAEQLGIEGLLRLHAEHREQPPERHMVAVEVAREEQPTRSFAVLINHQPQPDASRRYDMQPPQVIGEDWWRAQERAANAPAHVARVREAVRLLAGELMRPDEIWASVSAGPETFPELSAALDFLQRLAAARPR